MPDRPLGWAIVGCGRVTERRIAPAMKRADGARLVGFCSRDLARAGEFAGRHGAKRAYHTLEEVLADREVAAVYLAVPNLLHAEMAVRCLEAGRHVLVEKPLAVSVEHARKMADVARRTGRTLGVMHQQRFHPAHLHLIRYLDEKRLGRPNIVRTQIGIWYPPQDNWRLDPGMSGGGALMDLGPHVLDMLLEIGGPVARVSAWTGNLQFDYPVEDFVHARLEFRGGGIGLVEASYCVHAYGGRIEAYCPDGLFIADGSLQQAKFYRTMLRQGSASASAETCEDAYHDAFVAAIEDFTDAARERRQPTVSAEDGIAVLELIEAIYRSARTRVPVELA